MKVGVEYLSLDLTIGAYLNPKLGDAHTCGEGCSQPLGEIGPSTSGSDEFVTLSVNAE